MIGVPDPMISVLMTTYKNRPEAVKSAVDSILNQTYRDLELILVVEPGDPSGSMVRDKCRDARLVLIENPERLGRSRSYNVGLRAARGRYLARMDADDFSYPDRLEAQMGFLQANPDIAVVGTNVRVFDLHGETVGFRNFPSQHDQILRAFALINPMMHPTVIWDRDKVGRDILFDLRFSSYCDDLELWLRLLSQGHRFANLSNAYLDYQQLHDHRRPRENWQLNFAARLKHWRLGLRHPRLFIGLALYGILMWLPDRIIAVLTRRGRWSDRMRTLENNPVDSERGTDRHR